MEKIRHERKYFCQLTNTSKKLINKSNPTLAEYWKMSPVTMVPVELTKMIGRFIKQEDSWVHEQSPS